SSRGRPIVPPAGSAWHRAPWPLDRPGKARPARRVGIHRPLSGGALGARARPAPVPLPTLPSILRTGPHSAPRRRRRYTRQRPPPSGGYTRRSRHRIRRTNPCATLRPSLPARASADDCSHGPELSCRARTVARRRAPITRAEPSTRATSAIHTKGSASDPVKASSPALAPAVAPGTTTVTLTVRTRADPSGRGPDALIVCSPREASVGIV